MANLVLIFLYLQNIYFTSVSNSFLTAKGEHNFCRILFSLPFSKKPIIRFSAFSRSSCNSSLFAVCAMAGGCLIIAFTVLLYMEGISRTETTKLLAKSIFKDRSMLFMALPPILFVVSWECFHLSNELYPSTTEMAKNCKIIALAICSILILGRTFFMTQILGMCLVSFGMFKLSQVPYSYVELQEIARDPIELSLIACGLIAYGISFAMLEREFKRAESMFWIVGIQYCMYFVPTFLLIGCFNDWYFHNEQSFLAASDIFTWFQIVIYCAQMIMEFFVIKISDSIFMNMSYSTAIALIMLFGQSLQVSGLGSGFIIYGAMLYVFLEFTQSIRVNGGNNTADFRFVDRIHPVGDRKEILTFLPTKNCDDVEN